MSSPVEKQRLALALILRSGSIQSALRDYSRSRTVPVNIHIYMPLDSTVRADSTSLDLSSIKPMRFLMEQCLADHPVISTDKSVKGGKPVIRDTGIGVDYILDRLVVHGSVRKVANLFAPDVSEAEVKEVIAFARDFIEKACGQNEADD